MLLMFSVYWRLGSFPGLRCRYRVSSRRVRDADLAATVLADNCFAARSASAGIEVPCTRPLPLVSPSTPPVSVFFMNVIIGHNIYFLC